MSRTIATSTIKGDNDMSIPNNHKHPNPINPQILAMETPTTMKNSPTNPFATA
jgi:hypothetical protein